MADGNITVTYAHVGLRDYMAVHSSQPGISEIVAMAGLIWRGSRVWKHDETSLGSFEDWWESMSLEKRCELSARVRYAQADAMIRVRDESTKPVSGLTEIEEIFDSLFHTLSLDKDAQEACSEFRTALRSRWPHGNVYRHMPSEEQLRE